MVCREIGDGNKLKWNLEWQAWMAQQHPPIGRLLEAEASPAESNGWKMWENLHNLKICDFEITRNVNEKKEIRLIFNLIIIMYSNSQWHSIFYHFLFSLFFSDLSAVSIHFMRVMAACVCQRFETVCTGLTTAQPCFACPTRCDSRSVWAWAECEMRSNEKKSKR